MERRRHCQAGRRDPRAFPFCCWSLPSNFSLSFPNEFPKLFFPAQAPTGPLPSHPIGAGVGTQPLELGIIRERARSPCRTILGPCTSATCRAAFGAGRGGFSPGPSPRGWFTTPAQAFGSQGHLPISLRTSSTIHLEELRHCPQRSAVAGRCQRQWTEQHSSWRAGSPRKPGAHSSSGHLGGARLRQQRGGGVWANEPHRRQWGPEPVP